MKVISQLIDYFLYNGMLTHQDEEYLREKGYIKKYVDYDYYYEDDQLEMDEEDLKGSLKYNFVKRQGISSCF
jgi:hypothetical protein